jgi:hypothetical protein
VDHQNQLNQSTHLKQSGVLNNSVHFNQPGQLNQSFHNNQTNQGPSIHIKPSNYPSQPNHLNYPNQSNQPNQQNQPNRSKSREEYQKESDKANNYFSFKDHLHNLEIKPHEQYYNVQPAVIKPTNQSALNINTHQNQQSKPTSQAPISGSQPSQSSNLNLGTYK